MSAAISLACPHCHHAGGAHDLRCPTFVRPPNYSLTIDRVLALARELGVDPCDLSLAAASDADASLEDQLVIRRALGCETPEWLRQADPDDLALARDEAREEASDG